MSPPPPSWVRALAVSRPATRPPSSTTSFHFSQHSRQPTKPHTAHIAHHPLPRHRPRRPPPPPTLPPPSSRRRRRPLSRRLSLLAASMSCSPPVAGASGRCRRPRAAVVAIQRSFSRCRSVSRRRRRRFTSTTSPFLDTASVGVVWWGRVHATHMRRSGGGSRHRLTRPW